jgi:anaerobic selenocysteine-containing dehydrogenase
MTNGYTDIKNTDMMLIMGGNPAENHPCGFKWAIEAKRIRNAKMIVVDPRFTRTAATADLFLQIRAGADIAFLGGMIRYAIENNRIAHDYLVNYTNAAFIVKERRIQAARRWTVLRLRRRETDLRQNDLELRSRRKSDGKVRFVIARRTRSTCRALSATRRRA